MAGRKQRLIDRVNLLIGPRTGYWLSTVRPGFPAVSVLDPRLLSYREATAGHGVGYAASMGVGSLHGFALTERSHHPWVVAVRRYRRSGNPAATRPVLDAYYRLVRPSGVPEWLDIDPARCGPLAALPAVAAVMPWSLQTPLEALSFAERRIEGERKGYGLGRDVVLGSPSFGPMAEEQIAAEAAKLIALEQRLQAEPLDPTRVDYDVGAVVLLDGERLRWYCTAGRHRTAVAAALGLAEIPLAVRAVVRREEVDIWPQVSSRQMDRSAALDVFDRVIEGRPPALAEPWIDWVDETET